MVEWAQKFLGAGEAFLGEEIVELRSVLAGITSKFFDTYHRGNMDVSEVVVCISQRGSSAKKHPH